MVDWLKNPESNQTFKRAVNRGLVLDALREGPASRLSIHKKTGIRLSTIGELVEEMLAAELLTEAGAAPRNEGERGRPELNLALNLNGPFALGVCLDRERLRVGRVNLAGELQASHETRVESPEKSPRLLSQIAEEVKAVLSGGERSLEPCLGLGLSLPGILDVEAGRVMLASAFPGLEKGAPLGERVEKGTGVRRVLLGNVANSYLAAERLYGVARGQRDVVQVILEPGQIGAAVIADGRLVRGRFESSAEIGHFRIEADGPACACGGRGCLETFVSWPYLRRKLADRGRGDLAEAGCDAFWTSEHSTCKELRGEALRRIGRAIGCLVNLSRPALVVLSGSLAQHSASVVEPLQTHIRKEVLAPFARDLDIRTSALGDTAGVLGGASLVLQQVFMIPEVATI